jgi:TonB-dependent receptor
VLHQRSAQLLSRGLIVAAYVVIVSGTLHQAHAQSAPATISGQVADETGGLLPGVTVVLKDAKTGRERLVMTDSVGRFTADQLVPGSYTITATLAGFQDVERSAVDVGSGETTQINLALKVSSIRDSVVVRGTAANFASSVAGKRQADGVVDMFNADEIGRLPDKNIGETLNRIPGVSMLLEKGEGRFIQIRGISPRLNNVTINGMALGNGETESGGRLVPLDVVGGELLSGVQVFKTPTPDMDGQGIGGTLNLTTKQPFDFEKPFTMLVSSRAGTETISSIPTADTKEVPYALDATLTGKTMNNKVGWLGGVSFSNRMTPLLGLYNDSWRPVTSNGTTVSYPTNVKNNVTVTARERLNFNGAVELRPNAASTFFVRSFVVRWDELQLRNRFDEGLGDALAAVDATGGVVTADRVQVNLRSEPTIKKLQSVTAGGSHHAGRWTVDYTVQRNHNIVDEPNDNWEFRSGASTFGPDAFRIDPSGAISITSTGRDRKDPAFQTFRRLRYFQQLTTEDGWAGAVDVRRDTLVARSKPAFLKAGVKFARTSRETAVSQSTYNIGSVAWTAAQTATLTGGGFTNPVPLKSVPNLWLDLDGMNAFFEANRNDPRYFVLDQTETYRSEYQSDFTLDENVGAAYAMGKIDFGVVTLVGGARVERTDVDSAAFAMVTQAGRLTARPTDGSGDYMNVMPSIVSTFNLSRNLVARAAYTSALGRPEFDALAPRAQLGVEDNPTIGTIGTLSIGNPDLKARQSHNFDGSLEWYFDQGSLLSVAAFRKNIRNEIIPAPTKQFIDYEFQGQVYDRFDINTTINAEKAHVQGVELTFAHQFRFLPSPLNGFGVGTSATFIGSGVRVARASEVLTLPLLQQADRLTSFTLYYQRGRLDLSTTYKNNSNFLTDYGDSRALDLDQGGFGRWDCRAQFDLTSDLKMIFSGINLNDEPTTEFQGGIKSQITEYEYTGRTLFFGFTARVAR